jgi:hypothetical protein
MKPYRRTPTSKFKAAELIRARQISATITVERPNGHAQTYVPGDYIATWDETPGDTKFTFLRAKELATEFVPELGSELSADSVT